MLALAWRSCLAAQCAVCFVLSTCFLPLAFYPEQIFSTRLGTHYSELRIDSRKNFVFYTLAFVWRSHLVAPCSVYFILDTGVCEISTHPTCGQCRTPPSPTMSMFTDMGNLSATGLWNKLSCLLAAVGYLGVNSEIREAGSGHWKHQRHRDECLLDRHRYAWEAELMFVCVHFRERI